MSLWRRFLRRLADTAAERRAAERQGVLHAYDVLTLSARNDMLAERVERLEAENRDLRRHLAEARGEVAR